jgi:hypothetical protein
MSLHIRPRSVLALTAVDEGPLLVCPIEEERDTDRQELPGSLRDKSTPHILQTNDTSSQAATTPQR